MTTYKKGIAMYYIADGSTGCPLLETSLTSRAQAMVPLSELLAAQSEAKMLKDEVQAKVKDLAWMEGQLSKAQGQVNEARVEAAQLHLERVQVVEADSVQHLLADRLAALLHGGLGQAIPVALKLGVLFEIAADDVVVDPEQVDDRVGLVREHVGHALHVDDVVLLQVVVGVLRVVLPPLVALALAGVGLEQGVRVRVARHGQRREGVPVAAVGHLVVRNARHHHADRDGEGGLVLDQAAG